MLPFTMFVQRLCADLPAALQWAAALGEHAVRGGVTIGGGTNAAGLVSTFAIRTSSSDPNL